MLLTQGFTRVRFFDGRGQKTFESTDVVRIVVDYVADEANIITICYVNPDDTESNVQAEAAARRERGMVDTKGKVIVRVVQQRLGEGGGQNDGEKQPSYIGACKICRSNKPHIADCER